MLRTSWRESRARREAFRADSYGTLQNYPFSSSIGKNDFTELGQIESQATQIMNSKYTGQSVSSVAPGSAKKVTEEEQFYAYLCRVCASANAKENKTSKDSAENLKKNLISAGNSGANSTQSTAGLPADIPGTISASVDESVRKAIDQLCSDEGSKENKSTFHAEKVDSGSDKEAAKNNKNNLTKISELLKLLGQVAEAGRDKLYLQEYMTEMFSCYTDTLKKDGDGNLVAKAMNGKDMTNNPYFGAEAEYILWGNDSVTKNLQSTRAMIFGIRFALNAVYAFTSTDTTVPALTAATAIAGWTGFGVPIVKTVILLAWAMAESFVDVKALCDEGKAVALYKTTNTWALGYGGLKDKIKKNAANLIENVANTAIDDIFDKLENAAVDASGKLVDFGTNEIERYVNRTLDGVYGNVQSAITGPISQLALQITGASQALSQTDIMNKVEETLKGLKNNGSGLVNECIDLAIDSACRPCLPHGRQPCAGLCVCKHDDLCGCLYRLRDRRRRGCQAGRRIGGLYHRGGWHGRCQEHRDHHRRRGGHSGDGRLCTGHRRRQGGHIGLYRIGGGL